MTFDVLSTLRMICEAHLGLTAGEHDGATCPSCKTDYVSVNATKIHVIEGNDNYEAGWGGRGDLLVIPFSCEEGHHWDLCFGFHKGNTDTFIRFYLDDEPVDYLSYIDSLEWKEKAEAAKKRAGQRCQTCNAPRSSTTLDTHHRTYERLGQEQNEDLIVLCRKCHDLFHKNGKLVR